MSRLGVVVVFLAAEVWQLFFGAFTSLQLGAPGVGDRASWVPNVLVAETYTILPIGFALCVWGKPVGLVAAALCAVASLVLALAAVVALSSPESSAAYFLVLLAPPGIALLACARRRMAPTTPPEPR